MRRSGTCTFRRTRICWRQSTVRKFQSARARCCRPLRLPTPHAGAALRRCAAAWLASGRLVHEPHAALPFDELCRASPAISYASSVSDLGDAAPAGPERGVGTRSIVIMLCINFLANIVFSIVIPSIWPFLNDGLGVTNKSYVGYALDSRLFSLASDPILAHSDLFLCCLIV